MSVTSGPSFHHALGNPLAQTTPTAQQKVPTSTQTAAAPDPKSTQTTDAVARAEAPIRSEATASSASGEDSRSRPSIDSSERGAKIDIYA